MAITTQRLMDRLGHNIWLTSDMHYTHGNIIKYSHRPFLTQEGKELLAAYEEAKRLDTKIDNHDTRQVMAAASKAWRDYRMPAKNVEEHDETLIANHNACVQPNDRVFYLGDFAYNKPEMFFDRLNGIKHLVFGNHDKPVKKIADRFVWARDLTRIKIQYGRGKTDIQEIVLCHYAMLVWDKSHHGAWCCCGHSHNNCVAARYDTYDSGKLLDVGVDSMAYMLGGDNPKPEHYRPFSAEEIDKIMSRKVHRAVDHHR